jgi:hypothetical protein
MSETVQVGSQNQPNAPPPRAPQQTSWSPASQPQPPQNTYYPDEQNRDNTGFFEQASSAASSGAAYVVNGVEQFLNPEKTQSFSVNELIAKGENVTSAEKSILERQGYALTPNYERQVIGHESYEAHASRLGVSASFLRSWASKWGRDPTAIYGDVLTGYTWVKGTGESSLNTVKATAWGVLQNSYESGYNFGKNTLKPTLQDYGLYEPTKAAVYDLYNKSPVKYQGTDITKAAVYDLYNKSPVKYQGTDITGDTLRIAQSEGVPVTLSGGKFVIDAQGSEYENYAAQLGKIQTDLITKRNASIFGTGLTVDEGINNDVASLLPKSWSPKQSVIDYENSGQFGSGILKAITNVYGDWYNNKVAIAPVNALIEYGGEIAIGYATGLAIKGGTIALRVGAEGVSSALGGGAGVVSEGLTGRILGVGSRALVMGSEVEEASIAGRALNTVVNLSGKTAAAVDVGAGALRAGSKVIGVGSRYIEPATNAVMTYELGSDIAGSKSYEEGIGKVVGLAVGGIGYKLGSENAVKAYDMFRTKGMSEIPIENIVDAKVLSGETNLPLIEKGKTGADVVEMFKTPEGVSKGYHATPAEFKSETTTPLTQGRKTDMPGLYVSPEQSGPSIHFTRVGGNNASPYVCLAKGIKETATGVIHLEPSEIKSGVSKSITSIVGGPTPTKPAILHIDLKKGVERLPEEARYNIPNDKTVNGKIVFEDSLSRKVYQENTGTGRTFLTPVLESSLKGGGRAEAEAVITPDTPLIKTGAEGYISFKGRRIPVLSYATEATKTAPEFGKAKMIDNAKAIEAKDLKSSYSYGAIENKGILSDIGYPAQSIQISESISPSSIRPSSISVPSSSLPSSSISPGSISPSSIRPIPSSSIRSIPSSSTIGGYPINPEPVRPIRSRPPENIIGGYPINPEPVRPVRSRPPENIIGGYPINPEPVRPVRSRPPENIIGGYPINPEPIRPTPINSHSYVVLPAETIFKIDRFGNDKKDEYKPKKFVTPGISGTMKKGYLRNQFGSLEGFAKKAFSGDKVGFKKMKLK